MIARIHCPVYSTESKERVLEAILNLFPNVVLTEETRRTPNEMIGIVESREGFVWMRKMIHEERVIDAVRSMILAGWDGNTAHISMDKQAAYVGRIRLVSADEMTPPLGSISVNLQFQEERDFESFLAWLCPPTKDGHVIGVMDEQEL